MSINEFYDDDTTPESVTPSDATQPDAPNPFFDDEPVNVPDDAGRYPDQPTTPADALPALESIREDLTGLVRETQTIIPEKEFIIDVELDDESKTLLDQDLAEVIARDPEIMESLESISLCGERSVQTIIAILDQKIDQLKAR